MERPINNVYWNDRITEAVIWRCSAILMAPPGTPPVEYLQWLLLELIKPINNSMEPHAFL